MTYVDCFDLQIDETLHRFLVEEALQGTGVDAERFFAGLALMVHDLAPKNRELLAKRDAFQLKLDAWYRQNGAPSDLAAYESFLGYRRNHETSRYSGNR